MGAKKMSQERFVPYFIKVGMKIIELHSGKCRLSYVGSHNVTCCFSLISKNILNPLLDCLLSYTANTLNDTQHRDTNVIGQLNVALRPQSKLQQPTNQLPTWH